MNTLTTLLSLPLAKQVLAFEEVPLAHCRAVYEGIYPYTGTACEGEGYVRWALDSVERLLAVPHEEPLDEALMNLAVHVGEPAATLNMVELRDDLRRLCAGLRLTPPVGKEAVKLCVCGLLEDWAKGTLPPERTRAVLGCLHELLSEDSYGRTLDRLEAHYWGLVEHEELSELKLTQGLPSRRELLHEFAAYARRLAASMRVELLPGEDGLWQLKVRVPQLGA